MKNVDRWRLSANKWMIKNPTGFQICSAFITLLDFIHTNDWQGACHASSTILYSLLAAQGIEADIYLGEVSFGNAYFDHSWVEVEGEIYDAAISNSLVEGLSMPPVFRGIDLSTALPTVLSYGTQSGQGYDENARWIRGVSVSEYMSKFPDHPQGLFGMTKLIGKAGGIRISVAAVQRCARSATWKERP